ncbi:MAG TPA: chloride channel protein [Acidimicrobiia bacterium]|jgi:CIC family chloride channel protein
MTKPLESLRKLPAVGVLAEAELGGFLALSALVGIGVGVATALLVMTLRGIERLLSPILEPLFTIPTGLWDPNRLWIFLILPVALSIAWWVATRFAPEVAGDGVPEAAAALIVHGGRMRARIIPLKLVATAITVGPGGSAGREGPIVQIGGAIGSWISRRFHLGEDQVRSLVAAGAGAGIGASFNAPIAGMLFALEVILSSFAPRHMSGIVIASVAAAITSQSIVGPDLGLQTGIYRLGSFTELAMYALLAVLIVAFGVLFLRLLDRLERLVSRHERSWGVFRPIGAGLLVAGLIFLEPQLFGTGQRYTNALLLDEQVKALTGAAGDMWWVLLALGAGKAIATSLTISSGGSGGAFMPSLFMGAAVGTGFARLVAPFWTGPAPIQPGAFAVVGMAAMFAVVGRAPLTSILIVFEVTGARDYSLILPLMLTATLATFLAERFQKDSVYTQALRRKGITVPRQGAIDLLDSVEVGTVMAGPTSVSPSTTLAGAAGALHALRSHGIPVLDQGRLVGVVTTSDIARSKGDPDLVTVDAVMTRRPVTVLPDTPVSQALERMAALGVGRLPVVDPADPEKLIGIFRRDEAVRAYHEALSQSTDAEMTRKRLALRTDPGAGYYEFRVPAGSMADGRLVREVSWPEGSTLVSIQRGRAVIVPSGESMLRADDLVTAFGTEASKRQMIDRLNASGEEPTAEVDIAGGLAGEEAPPPS